MDLAKAFNAYTVGANQGDPECQRAVGCMYHDGKFVTQSYASAAVWLKRSAAQDYPPAIGQLGEYYFCGYGEVSPRARRARRARNARNARNARTCSTFRRGSLVALTHAPLALVTCDL